MELDSWMKFLEAFRHSSAHRISLYIPPFVVNPLKVDQYNGLSQAMTVAARSRRWEEFDGLSKEQQFLVSFRPMMATSIYGADSALFHPQILANFGQLYT